MLEKAISTRPKNGICTDFLIWGSWRGVSEEIALVMSKFLMKSRPWEDMRMDMNDDSVDLRWACEGVKRRKAMKITKTEGLMACFRKQTEGKQFGFVFQSRGGWDGGCRNPWVT